VSFVLTAICVEPGPTPDVELNSFQPLSILEARQDEGAEHRAGYIKGLERFFEGELRGRAYHVYANSTDAYPSSRPFVLWPDDNSHPLVVRIEPRYRASVGRFLRELLERSTLGRVLLVPEWNGAVTDPANSRDFLESGGCFIRRLIGLREFWRLHDERAIHWDALVVIER
jgi:hypothetical protein